MRKISFSEITSVVIIAAISFGTANAFASETKIWSDKKGLITVPFCERNLSNPIIDPKMNPYLAQKFSLSDGSEWRALSENGQMVSVDCLIEDRLRRYVIFEVRMPDSVESRFVGVTAEEMAVFDNLKALSLSEEHKFYEKSDRTDDDIPVGIEVQNGSLDYVVCVSGETLNVRDESLNKVLFVVNRHASTKPVQSFSTDRLKKVIDGVEYIFIKSEFPETKGAVKVGWVAEKYIVNRKDCPGAILTAPVEAPAEQAWTFPTLLRPSVSYKDGMRRFKASRSKGRLHAACDLYRITGEQANSVSTGTVIRDKYYFYEGTYAIEVKHTGGKVARYGEITGKAAPNIGVNKSVKTGQTIGYVGKVNSGCCTPMLHFELYSGTASGSLTQNGNSFQRRKDLIDPTNLLTEWEKLKFGTSY